MYDKKQIESSMNSPKTIWNMINQKIGKNRKRNNNIVGGRKKIQAFCLGVDHQDSPVGLTVDNPCPICREYPSITQPYVLTGASAGRL